MRRNLFALVFLIVVAVGYGIATSNRRQPEPASVVTPEAMQLVGRIGEGYFNFEIADSTAERVKGLSGREPLPVTDTLLFVFEQPGKHCFWMKDMKFAIDILWFDENKKLVYEKRNALPETYPESFCPDVAAKYVAEVTAGVAENNQIKLGDVLDVEL